jgi:hypothetical protein
MRLAVIAAMLAPTAAAADSFYEPSPTADCHFE